MTAVRAEQASAGYFEPGRTYLSAFVLAAALALGFVIDLAVGGGRAHLLGWAVAAVVLVGADVLVTRAARTYRSIRVSPASLQVGEAVVDRATIAGVAAVEPSRVDERISWLGLRPGVAPPRDSAPVIVRLTDGTVLAVATRRPDRLVAALLGAADVTGSGAGHGAGHGATNGSAGGGPARPVQDDDRTVRPATHADLALLPEIDERAETLFRVAGINLPVLPMLGEELERAAAVLVVGRPPVGFAQLDVVDGCAHLAEIAVVPSAMRRGLGSALLDASADWARAAGYPALTLTTYADVPWNGPFYAARGFVEVDDPTPGLQRIRARERDVGLDDAGRRIVMRRAL